MTDLRATVAASGPAEAPEAATRVDPQVMHERSSDARVFLRDRSGMYYIPPANPDNPSQDKNRLIALLLCLPELYSKFRWEVLSLFYNDDATRARQRGTLYEDFHDQLFLEVDSLVKPCEGIEDPEEDPVLQEVLKFRNRLEEIFLLFCRLNEEGVQKEFDKAIDALLEEVDFEEIFDLSTMTKIGQGAFGRVYRVYSPLLKTWFALKFLDPEKAITPHRVRDETQCGVQLNHLPNTPVTYNAQLLRQRFPGLRDSAGAMMIALEYIEGDTLLHVMENEHISPRETHRMVRELAFILAGYHEQGVLHRDLKPSNILRSLTFDLFVIDNGLSIQESQETGVVIRTSESPLRDGLHPTIETLEPSDTALDATSAFAKRPKTEGLLGTPLYMSPEHSADKVKCAPGSDVWSLGLIWLELELGEAVFAGFPSVTPMVVALGEHRTGSKDIRHFIEQRCIDKGRPLSPIKKKVMSWVFERHAGDRPTADQFGVLIGLIDVISQKPGAEREKAFWQYAARRSSIVFKKAENTDRDGNEDDVSVLLRNSLVPALSWIRDPANTPATVEVDDLLELSRVVDEMVRHMAENTDESSESASDNTPDKR